MRIVPARLSSVIVCGLLAIRMATAADGPPAWAYTPNNPDYKPPVDDGKPVRVPDSTAGYTWSQWRDRFVAPVWHPSDHGALPDIVANGRKPGVFACGYCHRATGPGGPENADHQARWRGDNIRMRTHRVCGRSRRCPAARRGRWGAKRAQQNDHATGSRYSRPCCLARELAFRHRREA